MSYKLCQCPIYFISNIFFCCSIPYSYYFFIDESGGATKQVTEFSKNVFRSELDNTGATYNMFDFVMNNLMVLNPIKFIH